MKILLLSSPLGRKEPPIFPLGLTYIAGALKKHSVKIVNLNLFSKPFQRLRKILKEEESDVVGISLSYVDTSSSYDKFFYFPFFVLCIRQIREISKDIPIIVGGTGFSLFAKQIMGEVNDIDFGVLFEGEETMPELIEKLTEPQLVKGVYYRNKGKICFTGKRDFLNFDNLPSPRRDMINLNHYKYFLEQMGVQTKRGCIFKCIYCTYPYLGGNGIRLKSPRKVADEIEGLIKLGINKMFFCDSVFNFPPEHAAEICQIIIREGMNIKWKALFNERFINQKFFLLAKKAGCELFILGSDGSNPMMLKNLRKNFTYGEIIRVYDLFKKDEVNFKCTFMLNGPGENIRTIFSTLKLILTLSLTNRFQFSIGNMRIYPHTELFSASFKKGLIRKNANLIYPQFYDPFPLRMVSYFFNLIGSFLYRMKRFRQYKITNRA